MKKLLAFLLIFVLCLTLFAGCTPHKNESISQNSSNNSTVDSSINNSSFNQTTEPTSIDELPLPKESAFFSFLSGVGAWHTSMLLYKDGTFEGEYVDADMGAVTDEDPNGTAYICYFNGEFHNFKKINDYTYSFEIDYIQTMKAAGEEWISNGTKYIASIPYGLEDGNEYILYLPNTPVSHLSGEFLSWWPYYYSDNKPKTLSCYGILNVKTNYGFFYEET